MTPRSPLMALTLYLAIGCHQQSREDTSGTRATSGNTIQSNEAAGRMVTPPIGAERPPGDQIGRQMEVRIDVGRYGNDVAFWWGTAPDDVLAVIARDVRTADERASGRSAQRALDLPPTGVVTLRGTIEPVPYAESMYSWGLTTADARRLAAKGVYLRLHEVVR